MTGVNRVKGRGKGRRDGKEEQRQRGIVNRRGKRVEVVFENKDKEGVFDSWIRDEGKGE